MMATLPLQPGAVRLMLIRDVDTGTIVDAEVFFSGDEAVSAREGLVIGLDGEFRDYPAPPAGCWSSLREQITRDAAIEQQLGDDYSESSGDLSWDSANQHWGRAEALREVLATMDRMEAGR
jgi:hypothetical protein